MAVRSSTRPSPHPMGRGDRRPGERRASSGLFVQRPVVLSVADFEVLISRSRFAGPIEFQRCQYRAGFPLKVAAIPFENRGQIHRVLGCLDAVFTGCGKELSSLVVQLDIQSLRNIGLVAQWRASAGRTHECEVYPRIPIFHTQNFVFEIVEGQAAPEEADNGLIPWAFQPTPDVFNALDRVVIQNKLECVCVVRVDKERDPLFFGPLLEFKLGDRRHLVEITVQVQPLGLQGRVVNEGMFDVRFDCLVQEAVGVVKGRRM